MSIPSIDHHFSSSLSETRQASSISFLCGFKYVGKLSLLLRSFVDSMSLQLIANYIDFHLL